MDTLLVTAAPARDPLESWLINALDLIIAGDVISTFHGQLKAMAEFALVFAVLADWKAPVSDWRRYVVQRLDTPCRERHISRSLVADPRSVPAHAWLTEALLIQGIEPLLSALEVLATLEARARLPGSYPWARIEALYLHNRLTRSIKARGDDVASSVSFSFSWPTQWRPLAHREIYELVHAVFFLSDFGCNRWEPGRDALLPHLAALNRSLGLAAKFCMGTGQLDLISEVALAMMCLDGRANVSQLIGALGAAQNLDGAIASRRHAHTVRDLYHATLVALLALCRVELQSTGSFFFSLPDPAASIK